jgi:hypothetical protein
MWITEMEETMTEISSNTTELSALAERATASGARWQAGKLDQRSELVLPARVLRALDSAGIRTVEELKAAGPVALSKLDGIGKLAFQQIVDLLRALDRQANGGDS